MNVKIIIGVIAVVVVAGVGIWYVSGNKVAVDTQSNSSPASENGAVKNGSGSGTLSAIFNKGGNYLCTFTSADPNAQSRGTVYIAGDKVRGNFESVVAQMGGQSFASYMLQNEGYLYTWSDMAPQGIKTKAVTAASGNDSAPFSDNQTFDAGVSVDYNCSPWSPDTNMFTIPSGVTFMELPTAQ